LWQENENTLNLTKYLKKFNTKFCNNSFALSKIGAFGDCFILFEARLQQTETPDGPFPGGTLRLACRKKGGKYFFFYITV